MFFPIQKASVAPVFQRMMPAIFGERMRVTYFQNDILVNGKDESEHDGMLKKVPEKLGYRFTISKKKCQLRTNSVTWLGHRISQKGIQPKPDLVKTICDAPQPDKKHKLQSSFGLSKYHSKFVKKFALKVVLLSHLLKKDM